MQNIRQTLKWIRGKKFFLSNVFSPPPPPPPPVWKNIFVKRYYNIYNNNNKSSSRNINSTTCILSLVLRCNEIELKGFLIRKIRKRPITWKIFSRYIYKIEVANNFILSMNHNWQQFSLSLSSFFLLFFLSFFFFLVIFSFVFFFFAFYTF